MKRSRLRNKYLNNNNEENVNCKPNKLYTQKRNYWVSLLRRTKKVYYENLDERKVSDKKLSWKTVKPLLSEKFNSRERTSLSENGEIVKAGKRTAEIFNKFFGNIVKNLSVSQYCDFDSIIENVKYPTLKAIPKYKKTL